MCEYRGLDYQRKKGLEDLVRATRGGRYSMLTSGANIYRLDTASGEITRFKPEDFDADDFEEEETEIEETEEETDS